MARRDVAQPVREALARSGTLFTWAASQPERETFTGRGITYGVAIAGLRAVVRHAHRGGAIASLLRDRYFGAPRFLREITMAKALAEAGIPTPAVLAGVRYSAGFGHRADVCTERADGVDLAATFFGANPPEGHARESIWRAVGALVRRLHEAGFVHDDLQLRNILVESGPPDRLSAGPPARSAWLLDVDTCRRVGPGNLAARRQNLARFDRSWDKWNRLHGAKLSAWDHETFTSAYVGRPG